MNPSFSISVLGPQMASPQRALDVKAIQDATARLNAADAALASARSEVDSAQSDLKGATASKKPEAEQRLKEAQAKLESAQKEREEAERALRAHFGPTESSEPTGITPGENESKTVQLGIRLAIFALVCALAWMVWPGDTSKWPPVFTIGLPVAMVIVVLIVGVILVFRPTRGGGGNMTGGQSRLFAAENLQFLSFGALALVVLIFLMYGIVSQALLPSLSSISVSRGLITFLIAVVTVTIALILVLATVVSDSPDRDRRFVQGKEILTMLIGVLGTIVGFYFGNSEDGTKALSIKAPVVSKENLKSGDSLEITSFISGGKSPFHFDVTFQPADVVDAITEAQSSDGKIQVDLKVKDVDKEKQLFYSIKVRDNEGRTGLFDSKSAGKSLNIQPKDSSAGSNTSGAGSDASGDGSREPGIQRRKLNPQPE